MLDETAAAIGEHLVQDVVNLNILTVIKVTAPTQQPPEVHPHKAEWHDAAHYSTPSVIDSRCG
jgi:hypothetical protein